MPQKPKKRTREVCNRCGRSVAWGSGRFVNRIPDFNPVEERQAMGRPSPWGEYLCAECEEGCPRCDERLR